MGWLILFIVLLVIEIFTMGLTTIWFAGGAVSVILLVMTRPIAVKYFNTERQKTNAESLIGLQAVVLQDVDTLHASGLVEVNGQEWSAKTDEADGYIPKDSVVSIEGIQGVKLIVKAKEVKRNYVKNDN